MLPSAGGPLPRGRVSPPHGPCTQIAQYLNMDAAEQVAMFVELTGGQCPPEQAQFFLQSAGGNLEFAVNLFLSQEEGAGPMDEGSDGEDEGEDGYDEDADMSMPPLIPVSASAPAGHPPPSKRPKVTHLRLAPPSPKPPWRS